MTLVLSVHGRDTMWLVVDRRLSYGGRRPPIDDAMKVMVLDTIDGRGLLAYAGLGATSRGTQPSEWMSSVLRGRGGLTFEQALGVLSDAASREMPRHLASMPGGAHFIIVPVFVRGVGSRLYCIDIVVDSRTRQHSCHYRRFERPAEQGSQSLRMAVGGTGGIYLHRMREAWMRPLRRLVKAHDRGRVSELLVADYLASLNYEAHQAVRDGTVGHRCIVVWRRRPDARRAGPGGGHQFYTRLDRDATSGAIPTIANGMDVEAIGGIFMQHILDRLAQGAGPDTALDPNEFNRLLGNLPGDPDDKLR